MQGTFWPCLLPSHLCLHAETILCPWHEPHTCWSGDNLGAGVGKGGSPFLEKSDPSHTCLHAHTHSYPSGTWLHHRSYLGTNGKCYELPLHILIILKIPPFLTYLTHPWPVPSASPISHYFLSGLISPHRQLYTVPWINANSTVGVNTLLLESSCPESLDGISIRVFRKVYFSISERGERRGESWPLPDHLLAAYIFFSFVWGRAS